MDLYRIFGLMNCRPAPCDDPLLAGLSPADLVRLGLVDWAARHRVQDFIKRSFHLPSTLAVFFTRSEVETLRYVMMDTGAVIVGDIVLHFLGRVSTHESVLELAVAYSATSRLGMFLNQLGFTCESSPSGNHSFASLFYEQDGFPEEWGEDGEALLCSFDFIRPSNGTNSVRILVARVCPVDYVLDLPCSESFLAYGVCLLTLAVSCGYELHNPPLCVFFVSSGHIRSLPVALSVCTWPVFGGGRPRRKVSRRRLRPASVAVRAGSW